MNERERLTKREGACVYINTAVIPRKNCEGDFGFFPCQLARTCKSIANRKCPLLMVLDRLAEYEDEAEKALKERREGE